MNLYALVADKRDLTDVLDNRKNEPLFIFGLTFVRFFLFFSKGASAAGCARWLETGASANPVRHVRTGIDAGRIAQEVREGRWRGAR